MKPLSFSPTKLDVAAFARAGEQLAGQWPASSLERLADAAAPEQPASGWSPVVWQLAGELRQPKAGGAQVWLRVRAEATVWLTCQRCLQALSVPLALDRWLYFVDDEAQAAALDLDSEDDVLALPRHLDARELIEDELLLALPLVPKHERCPQPLPDAGSADADLAPEPSPKPFAALAVLKRKG